MMATHAPVRLSQARIRRDRSSTSGAILSSRPSSRPDRRDRRHRRASGWSHKMNDAETRAALVRHWSDVENLNVTHEIYHDDAVLEFPQGGERLVGLANIRAVREAYPAEV